MTEDAIRERQEASKVHGAYSYEKRGEAALDKPKRGRLGELKEQVQDRPGILDLIQENAIKAVMMVEIVTSYIANQKMAGVPLEEIGVLRTLPAFMNSAQRALRDLIQLMPDNKDAIDAASILEEVKRRKDENEERTD